MSTRPSTKDILTYPLSASEQVVNVFNKTMAPFFDKQLTLLGENQTLAALRDSLLPRLMSGELRVGAAQDIIEEAL